jgi:hypothetical protein
VISLFSFQGQDQNKNKIIIIFKADDSFYFQRQQQVPDSIAVIRECIFFFVLSKPFGCTARVQLT